MSDVTIRITMPKEMKEKAESLSQKEGFASLKTAILTFLDRYIQKEVDLDIQKGEYIHFSKRALKRFAQMEKDIKEGKNIHKAKDIDDFIYQLETTPLKFSSATKKHHAKIIEEIKQGKNVTHTKSLDELFALLK